MGLQLLLQIPEAPGKSELLQSHERIPPEQGCVHVSSIKDHHRSGSGLLNGSALG